MCTLYDYKMNHYILFNILFGDQRGTMVKIKIKSNCTTIINYWFDHRRVFVFTSSRFELAYIFVFVPLIFSTLSEFVRSLILEN